MKENELNEDNHNFKFVGITVRNDQGKDIFVKPCVTADSCFFKGVKLSLFYCSQTYFWSNVHAIPKGEKDTYFTKEGLRDKFELPNEVVINFREALGCYLHGFNIATVVLARRLLEQVLISKGATPNKRVCDMIKELVNWGILDGKLKDLADGIKYLGNIGAHVKEEDANKDDAKQALEFSDWLITWLFGKVKEVTSGEHPSI